MIIRRGIRNLALAAALLASSGGCSALLASMRFEPALSSHRGHLTWKECIEIMSEPDPEGSVDLGRAALRLFLATVMMPFDLSAMAIGIPPIEIFESTDMPVTKAWCSWWYILFSSRKLRTGAEALTFARGRWGWSEEDERPGARNPGFNIPINLGALFKIKIK